MTYVPENPDEKKQHRACHTEVMNGVYARAIGSDAVIWTNSTARITVVTPLSSNSQRVRATKVARLANLELRYDFGIYHEDEPRDERDIHLFLYYVRNRIVGLGIMEKRTNICRCTWNERERREFKKLESSTPVWSLGIMWVHRGHRRKKVASTLFAEAAKHLHVDQKSVAFYTPFTQEGERFVRSLCPEEFMIAK
jgi:GNAT superfamily N-acetyltransferase